MSNLLSVIVPSFKRPIKLKECLKHLECQTLPAFEIIVVLREFDIESIHVVNEFQKIIPQLKLVYVHKVGVIFAENEGLKHVTGNIVCFIDDDGNAPQDWLYKINDFFTMHPNALAYGGSDIIKSEPWTYHDYVVDEVGIIKWYGHIIGNHHRKALFKVRNADVLKGVNMSFRRSSFDFLDENLSGNESTLGNGSQWELDICMRVNKDKKSIFFDPGLVVIHDSDHSNHNHLIASKNNAHNLAYVYLKNSNWTSRFIFICYSFIIGNTQLPGFIWFLIAFVKGPNRITTIRHYLNKFVGFILGIRLFISKMF
jgi:glycosyltransferase involved in cell wall biosynthesis